MGINVRVREGKGGKREGTRGFKIEMEGGGEERGVLGGRGGV